MKIQHFIIIAATLAFAGCKSDKNNGPTTWTEPEPITTDTMAQTAEEPEAKADDYFEKMVTKPAAPKPAPKPVVKKAKQEPAETIYVETDGAQGRVWGHVTMRGDRGNGTIHDWDENTLTVSVTRHGNELFAVDQNSRQYVFKLKKTTQQ